MGPRFLLNGFWKSGPTYKAALMLSLSDEPFAYRSVDIRGGENKQPEYVAKSRFGQVPCLEDRSAHRCLVQSAVILQYLAETLDKFEGATDDKRFHIREWMFWNADKLTTPIIGARRVALGVLPDEPALAAHFARQSALGLKVLDDHLDGRDWIVGARPTIADVDIYPVLSQAGDGHIDLAPYTNILALMRRIEALPGFRKAAELLPQEDAALVG